MSEAAHAKKETIELDIAIIGGGSAGITLAAALDKCSAIVVEPLTPGERDCSWALWADIKQQRQFAKASRGSWERWRLVDHHYEIVHCSNQYRYTSLSSAHYISQCEASLKKGVSLVREAAEDIISVGNGGSFIAGGQRYSATQLYNSRPPKLVEHSLKQHFLGWEIRTKAPISDPDIATLMDFRVDQSRGLHFIYVLPYSDRRLLIESTMISQKLECKDWYRHAIVTWLKDRNIEIEENLSEETGVIPMQSLVPSGDGIASIGAASGAVRLSSGYAFTAIQTQIASLASGIASGRYAVPRPISPMLIGMDKIFNRVLVAEPDLGVSMMMGTAKALDADGFARFMLGSATLLDWIKVVMAMPKIPFLRQVFA